MKAEIIAVGTELLLGDILNTNARYLSRELASLGVDVYNQSVVGDNYIRLKEAFEHAFLRSDLIITTGGLGPTEDDITKETGAKYFNKKMVLDERSLNRLKKYFGSINREMTENNIKQAYVPEGAIVLYNDNGTAPGIIIEDNDKILVSLPGPPKEAIPLFENQVKPFLLHKQEYTFISRVLRVVALGESMVETMIKDIIDKQTNPTVAPYAKDMEVILRITAKAKTEKDAKKLIEPVAQKIYARLGDNIYGEGDTSIQETVAQMLVDKNMTISVSESCTGGLVSSCFIEFPGASKAFCEGVVTYSNESKMKRLGVKKDTLKRYGAVSHEVAAEMADGIAKTSQTDIGLSTTGVAGPDGGTAEKPVGLVYIGLSIDGVTKTKELKLSGNRQKIRQRATQSALDWLRRELLSIRNF